MIGSPEIISCPDNLFLVLMRHRNLQSFIARTSSSLNFHRSQSVNRGIRYLSYTMDNRAKLQPAARVAGRKQDVWYVYYIHDNIRIVSCNYQHQQRLSFRDSTCPCSYSSSHLPIGTNSSAGRLSTKPQRLLPSNRLSTWVKASLDTILHHIS